MIEQSPAVAYTNRAAAHAALARPLDREVLGLGIGRIVVVAISLAVALARGLTLPWVVAALLLFLALTVVQDVIVRRRNWQHRLAQINTRELAALRGEAPFGLPFDSPPAADHRYAEDLELFNERGLFCFLSRCTTAMGRKALAAWLSAAADQDTIRARQDAVRELAEHLDHRQALAAHGPSAELGRRQAGAVELLAAAEQKPIALAVPGFVLIGVPVATLAMGTAAWFFPPAFIGFVALIVAQALLRRLFARRVDTLLRESSGCAGLARTYAAILQTIEAHPSKAARLSEIQQGLCSEGVAASAAIRRLATLLEWADVRHSEMMGAIVNSLLLWDLNCARLLAGWQRRFRSSIGTWFDAIGEWEALSSFATAAFNHADWTWPRLLPEGGGMRAKGLGHPLIPDEERVAADVALPGPGSIWIVTGPNMAGKSTFLRTVGVAIVMAQAGAPVCAQSFELAPLELITSMRISDSLDKKLSLFYAELQRLKQILDAVDAGEPVFFLIDEMLKGTNTLDRQAGAVALVRQLQRDRASGVVATHDLGLARLAKEAPDSIVNFHFDGTVEGDRLLFDYRLREGACERFNALSLMRAIGIHLDDPERASLQDPA